MEVTADSSDGAGGGVCVCVSLCPTVQHCYLHKKNPKGPSVEAVPRDVLIRPLNCLLLPTDSIWRPLNCAYECATYQLYFNIISILPLQYLIIFSVILILV